MKRWSVIAITLFFLGVTLLVVALFLFLPNLLPKHLQGTGDRLALAQLVISLASLLALLLAAWEFSKAQRRPELHLMLQPIDAGLYGEPATVYILRHIHSSEQGFGTVYKSIFKLVVDNPGDAPARWVKISIELIDPRPPVPRLNPAKSVLERSLSYEPASGAWTPAQTVASLATYVFHGGDDFIVYSRPKKVKALSDWLEDIGHFELKVPIAHDENEQELVVQVVCSVQADGFVSHDRKLRFRRE